MPHAVLHQRTFQAQHLRAAPDQHDAPGVQIEALIEYVDLFQQGDATLDARKALLVEQRDQLVSRMAEMQASLDLLNQKIDRYEQGMMTAEQQLRRLHAEREGA